MLQIFWKGDPGIENFVIRFLSIEVRDKWHRLVKDQIKQLPKSSLDSAVNYTSQTQFTSMVGPPPENPFLKYEEDDEDGIDLRISNATTLVNSQADYLSSRNGSTTSLRSRSTTGGSGPPAGSHNSGAPVRVPPPRFPIPEPGYGAGPPPLKISTSFPMGLGTPDDRIGNSYFSPTAESPSSLRSGLPGSMYPFPRQPTSSAGNWPADGNKHNTAPPMGRAPLREDESVNSFSFNNRPVQRPSLPVLPGSQSAQQLAFAQNRSRSMSSPDVHNQPSPVKRLPNGQVYPGTDEVPVPPIPPHMRTPVNRSQTNSPTDNPRRVGAQSPHLTRTYTANHDNYDQGSNQCEPRATSRHGPGPTSSAMSQRLFSPHVPANPRGEAPYVSQLKVKIYFEPMPSHVTIVVPIIIKHRSLVDRIDSKMEKVTPCSIAKGTARLRYKDMEDEMITITNDEDVELAIEEWTMANEKQLQNGTIPDFELYFFEATAS